MKAKGAQAKPGFVAAFFYAHRQYGQKEHDANAVHKPGEHFEQPRVSQQHHEDQKTGKADEAQLLAGFVVPTPLKAVGNRGNGGENIEPAKDD